MNLDSFKKVNRPWKSGDRKTTAMLEVREDNTVLIVEKIEPVGNRIFVRRDIVVPVIMSIRPKERKLSDKTPKNNPRPKVYYTMSLILLDGYLHQNLDYKEVFKFSTVRRNVEKFNKK